MARFYGKVGYVETYDNGHGVYEDRIVEHNYIGDVLKTRSGIQSGEYRNDNITIHNSISIIADAFAFDNYTHVRYVEWMGSKIEVTDVEVQRPRLILTLGGVYNE